ncbi:hypothetical protein [Roseateles amylovorans]|uniref:Uncharacterized protein n=1 Tax=Roseateles amylovorans TaxID=2978473 RepID=A0ABY6BBI9_9BURK|nr:hypothetical protein [Roseateles amylovorans]UXH80557.1 hypothetical protein N4261_12070 [Roseateles amylovorans]
MALSTHPHDHAAAAASPDARPPLPQPGVAARLADTPWRDRLDDVALDDTPPAASAPRPPHDDVGARRRPAASRTAAALTTPPSTPRWLEALATWQRGQHQITQALEELTRTVMARCNGEPDADEIQTALSSLTDRLPTRDAVLLRLLEGGDPAVPPLSPQRRLSEALATIACYQEALDDELLDELEHNGFLHCSLRQPLTQALDDTLAHLVPSTHVRP